MRIDRMVFDLPWPIEASRDAQNGNRSRDHLDREAVVVGAFGPSLSRVERPRCERRRDNALKQPSEDVLGIDLTLVLAVC